MTADETWKRIAPRWLTWPEVDPARHPFDPTGVLDVVRSLAPPVPPPPRWEGSVSIGRSDAERWRETVSHALVDHYGRWANGWCWSQGEGDYDGGPGTEWCCVSHSISSPEETLALVAGSLVQWRAWLEDLAERFDRFLPLPNPDESPDALVVAWDVAVAQLVNLTVGRTSSDSGWYGHCKQVLSWFLVAAGLPEDRHSTLIDDAIGGRFRSWVQPSAADVADVAERLAQQLVAQSGVDLPPAYVHATDEWPDTWPQGWPSSRTATRSTRGRDERRPEGRRPDDLETWQAVRAQVDWGTASEPVSGPVGTGEDAIAEHAASRPTGGPQLAAAVDQAGRAAAAGGPLGFALLAQWQGTLLGVPEPAFRDGPAWAKGGRERYYWHADLPSRFEACLLEATEDDLPLPSRAARVYLDVAFFHPFDDGNARSAMLALYFVLAREGVILDRAAPLLRTVRQAHDKYGAAGLAKLVELLIRGTPKRMRP
ncbi:Fic family protein [Micromonospora sp. NPDC048839]|uniref:Fic family protein n=1 Tax=Micromonospora sp. NPDC048839 TaxID=3155641 RepID=UPI0033CA8BD5